ncbi:MAG: flagellar basal body P-ring formation protein FlgA [Planctomycetaceae bacterium]|nr:flagellar basal body P-ring formation protein FlgA [Planctomycetaceae bacterium]
MRLFFCTHGQLHGIAIMVAAVIGTSSSGLIAGEGVSVRLRDQVRVSQGIVRVSHLAEVSGDDPEEVARVGQLDVMSLSQDNSKHTLPREQLLIRLLLAGYAESEIRVSGPQMVTVSQEAVSSHASTDIETAAAMAMAQALDVPREDVRARLAAPLDLPFDDQGTSEKNITIDVLPPVRPSLGRVRLTVRLLKDGQLKQTVNGLFDVRLRQAVVVASEPLVQGTVLTADHLTTSDDWTDVRHASSSIPQLLDRQVRRAIPAGEPVSSLDLQPIRTTKARPLISARDTVRLVVRHGTLTVIVPTAEALQSGQQGELIRVRNLDSRKVVVGRIVSAGEVEVQLE